MTSGLPQRIVMNEVTFPYANPVPPLVFRPDSLLEFSGVTNERMTKDIFQETVIGSSQNVRKSDYEIVVGPDGWLCVYSPDKRVIKAIAESFEGKKGKGTYQYEEAVFEQHIFQEVSKGLAEISTGLDTATAKLHQLMKSLKIQPKTKEELEAKLGSKNFL